MSSVWASFLPSFKFPSNEKHLKHSSFPFLTRSSGVFAVRESLIASLSPFLPADVYATVDLSLSLSVSTYTIKIKVPLHQLDNLRPYTNSAAETKNTWTEGMDTCFPHFTESLSYAHLSYVYQARYMYTI